jgi:hypothetical protein
MLKIFANHNKQDVTYSCTLGQVFPKVDGKLLRLELNGNELAKFAQLNDIPVYSIDNSYLIWQGRCAGRTLQLLREMFEKSYV